MNVCVCVCVCLAGSVQDARHGWSDGGRRDWVDGGGGARALVAVGNGPPAAILADEGAVLVELDVHAVAVFGQRVVAAQLTLPAQRRLAVRALLVCIADRGEGKVRRAAATDRCIGNYSDIRFRDLQI